MYQWQLQEVKARLSHVIDRAQAGEPQIVTRHGKRAAVIVSYDEYLRLHGAGKSALDLFAGAPRMDDEDLPLMREAEFIRPVDLS